LTPERPSYNSCILHTLATQLKYDKSRGVNYNVEVLASAIQHPYGEVLLRSPSYCDFRFFYETKSQSSYSDALYNALNEFEEFVAMHIIKRVKMLLDKSKSKALIELREKYKEIAYKILAFIRVAPNEINLTRKTIRSTRKQNLLWETVRSLEQ